jgi:hypothetical protein
MPPNPDEDDLSAIVLNHIPSEGTTLPQLIKATSADPAQLEVAVQQLRERGFVEMTGDMIYSTPFVQKARGLFKFVS